MPGFKPKIGIKKVPVELAEPVKSSEIDATKSAKDFVAMFASRAPEIVKAAPKKKRVKKKQVKKIVVKNKLNFNFN